MSKTFFPIPMWYVAITLLRTLCTMELWEHKYWRHLQSQTNKTLIWGVFSFSLVWSLPFLVSQKATKESPTPKLSCSFSLLNFPYSVVLFFFLVEEPKEPLTLIWKPLWSLRILLVILKEFDTIFKITWTWAFIIVLRITYLATYSYLQIFLVD